MNILSLFKETSQPLAVAAESRLEVNKPLLALMGYADQEETISRLAPILEQVPEAGAEIALPGKYASSWVRVIPLKQETGILYVFENLTAHKYIADNRKAVCDSYTQCLMHLRVPALLVCTNTLTVHTFNEEASLFFKNVDLKNKALSELFQDSNILAKVQKHGQTGELIRGCKVAKSEHRYADLGVGIVPYSDNQPFCYCITFYDVSHLKAVEFSLRAAIEAYQYAEEGILICDGHNTIVGVNPAFERISGWKKAELVGTTPKVLASGLHDATFYTEMWQAIHNTGGWEGELWDRRKNGEVYPAHSVIRKVQDAEHGTTHYLALVTDLSEMHKKEEALTWMSKHDYLTSLPNKALFSLNVKEALNTTTTALAVVLDLDRFKHINDTLGHEVGDVLLFKLAERLAGSLEPGDFACRQSGDEFLVFIAGDEEECELKLDALLEVLKKPYQANEHDVSLSFSIGTAAYPVDGASFDLLYRHADGALRYGRSLGEDGIHKFRPEMHRMVAKHFAMEQLLRKRIEANELIVMYQPRVALVTGKILGFEALVRILDDEGFLVPPLDFIPIAESSGLIVPLGLQVLTKACQRIKLWKSIPVAVNVSVAQMVRPEFFSEIMQVISEAKVSPSLLELEITESLMMECPEEALNLLWELHNAGIKLAIDDFGTGYSSLAYLKRLPASKLKIDKSFVEAAHLSKEDAVLIEAIVNLAQAFDMDVIAEGVETEESARFLLSKGCTEAQGFLYGRPQEAKEWFK